MRTERSKQQSAVSTQQAIITASGSDFVLPAMLICISTLTRSLSLPVPTLCCNAGRRTHGRHSPSVALLMLTRGQRPEIRDQRPETKRPEVRGQRSEAGDQKSEIRNQRSEVRAIEYLTLSRRHQLLIALGRGWGLAFRTGALAFAASRAARLLILAAVGTVMSFGG